MIYFHFLTHFVSSFIYYKNKLYIIVLIKVLIFILWRVIKMKNIIDTINNNSSKAFRIIMNKRKTPLTAC